MPKAVFVSSGLFFILLVLKQLKGGKKKKKRLVLYFHKSVGKLALAASCNTMNTCY